MALQPPTDMGRQPLGQQYVVSRGGHRARARGRPKDLDWGASIFGAVRAKPRWVTTARDSSHELTSLLLSTEARYGLYHGDKMDGPEQQFSNVGL